jgi:hypothetical protein
MKNLIIFTVAGMLLYVGTNCYIESEKEKTIVRQRVEEDAKFTKYAYSEMARRNVPFGECVYFKGHDTYCR